MSQDRPPRRRSKPTSGTEYVRGLERLAAAVLLFHRGGPWTLDDMEAWEELTDTHEATTKSLCDFARKVQAK